MGQQHGQLNEYFKGKKNGFSALNSFQIINTNKKNSRKNVNFLINNFC